MSSTNTKRGRRSWVVIPCSSQKTDAYGLVPAVQRYRGPLFRASLRWAMSVAPRDHIVILSAKYRFLKLDDRIPEYDTTWGDRDTADRYRLTMTAKRAGLPSAVYVCGGKKYFEVARDILGPGAVPAHPTLGIGSLMKYLKENQGRLPR